MVTEPTTASQVPGEHRARHDPDTRITGDLCGIRAVWSTAARRRADAVGDIATLGVRRRACPWGRKAEFEHSDATSLLPVSL
jgi:hypothetical protein